MRPNQTLPIIPLKKISSIKLRNFRAYFGEYEPITMPNGENLLIYGENGSGKSSLFKAINNYLQSSRDATISYVKNRYSLNEDGEIELSFVDYDLTTSTVVPNTLQNFNFTNVSSTNNVSFIQNASLVKGFLDYRDLLDVYFHREPQPNLFRLIVLSLLGNHIPVSSGGNFRFGPKWNQLQKDLIDNAYTRLDRCHKNAKAELPSYQTHLSHTLNEIFAELNRMLITYFPDLKITLGYVLQDMIFNYQNDIKEQWFTPADLRLKITKDGIPIQGDYSDILNEARLSAFAICLYLASLKRNPSRIDFKILYLDDIFVGLDAGNRIPILKIIQNEFSDYQVFISSYDRHSYELAKRHFDIHVPQRWKTVEFYVGKAMDGEFEFQKPIVVDGETSFEKAIQFLHDRSKPDYPASANYFRKALEEIIQNEDFIPKWETADIDNTQIPNYKLGPLIYRARRFLNKTSNSTTTIDQILGLLHVLLHPLSHHEISSPVYKGELIIVEHCVANLKEELANLDVPNNYKCSQLEGKNKITIKYVISAATSHYSFYEIRTNDSICLKYNPNGLPIISKVQCTIEKCWGENNGAYVQGSKKTFSEEEKKNPINNFNSLEDAYNEIHSRMTRNAFIGNFPKVPDYLSVMTYLDAMGIIQPLVSAVVW